MIFSVSSLELINGKQTAEEPGMVRSLQVFFLFRLKWIITGPHTLPVIQMACEPFVCETRAGLIHEYLY